MKLVGIFSLASGGLEDYATGTQYQHESILFRALWDRLEKGGLLLGDRGFCSYGAMAQLSQRGIDSLLRLHQARKATFREGRRLGKDDRLVTWQKPAQRTDAWSVEEGESLPAELSLRLIRLAVSTPGFRTRTVTLATSLTDADAYPADQIRALYGQRWEVELHFHQIKILLGLDILRCKSPELIEKETLIHFIAYNMIRLFMQKAAGTHRVNLDRISFNGTLDTVRHFANAIHAARATPRGQEALIEQMLATIAGDPVPERPGCSEPLREEATPEELPLTNKTKVRNAGSAPPQQAAPTYPKRLLT